MNTKELQERTKKFALDIITFTERLPNTRAGNVLGKQLLRAGTPVGANYRAACRSISRADFISKINIVEEEADECMYWLDLIEGAKISNQTQIDVLRKEADELTAIFTASGRTAKQNK